MASPLQPKDRLDRTSVEDHAAADEARRAQTAERQSMLAERSMQRQMRRAVRHGDIAKIATLSRAMTDMGLSPLGGGGIQSAQENDRIARDRAFNRADQLNQIGGRSESEQAITPVDNENYDTNASEIEGAVSKMPQPAATPPAAKATVGDTKDKFLADLDRSNLFQEGNADAIEKAAARGSKFGFSPDQIKSYAGGSASTPSGNVSERKAPTLASLPPDTFSQPEEPSALLKQATAFRDKSLALKKQIEEGSADVSKQLAQGTETFGPDPLSPPLPAVNPQVLENARAASKQYRVQKGLDQKSDWENKYWNAPVDSMDTNDERYAAAKLKQETHHPSVGGIPLPSPDTATARTRMIDRAIREGVDITPFTRQDKGFDAQYRKALDVQKDYINRTAQATRIREAGANLLPTSNEPLGPSMSPEIRKTNAIAEARAEQARLLNQ